MHNKNVHKIKSIIFFSSLRLALPYLGEFKTTLILTLTRAMVYSHLISSAPAHTRNVHRKLGQFNSKSTVCSEFLCIFVDFYSFECIRNRSNAINSLYFSSVSAFLIHMVEI